MFKKNQQPLLIVSEFHLGGKVERWLGLSSEWYPGAHGIHFFTITKIEIIIVFYVHKKYVDNFQLYIDHFLHFYKLLFTVQFWINNPIFWIPILPYLGLK